MAAQSGWAVYEKNGTFVQFYTDEARARDSERYYSGRTIEYLSSELGVEQTKLSGRYGMKTFFVWLFVQCIFARLMVGMCLGLWSSMKISPDFLGWFMAPAVLVCLAEAITSSIVVYPLINPTNRR